MNYYQLTINELFDDTFKPIAESHHDRGIIDYFCPICKAPVGILAQGPFTIGDGS